MSTESTINEAASLMGKRSAAVREAKWGKKEFVRRMREYGRLGGRPRKKKANKSKREKEGS